MRKISLFVLSAAFALTTLVGCNSAAEPVVEEPVIEEAVEETTPEPIEEVVEEPVDETPAFVFGQEEPEYVMGSYTAEDVIALTDELLPIYEGLECYGYDKYVVNAILSRILLLNQAEIEDIGSVSAEAVAHYGLSIDDLNTRWWDEYEQLSTFHDFMLNNQAREYALVLDEARANDINQFIDYMNKNEECEFTYDFKYNAYFDDEDLNPTIRNINALIAIHEYENGAMEVWPKDSTEITKYVMHGLETYQKCLNIYVGKNKTK